MLPLRVAILWHQHQPYYRKGDEFILPWVRLHGVKDYYDLPALLREFPRVRQTFNLVPSLLLQVQDYMHERAGDAVERYTLLPADALNTEQKQFLLDNFFLCNADRMILPYKRYNELYECKVSGEALEGFTTADWRDLQTWYNLTWIGPVSRKRDDVQRLFDKGRNFTEQEKQTVLDIHRRILAQVLPLLKSMQSTGQVELSVTPAFHPILPLLCNSDVTSVAMPEAPLPRRQFSWPVDAQRQIRRGLDIFLDSIGSMPSGMWPAEGSVSTEALSLIAGSGLRWAATDEFILARTLGDEYHELDKYYPYTFRSAEGKETALLFRDHVLSDLIGFVYSNWNPADAAANFCERLKQIREKIIASHEEEALQTAVVPVILDGENCWEYYEGNGEEFLRELFKLLDNTPELTTVTCSEAVHVERRRTLDHVHPGSWINANFSIWIGHEEDNAAWDLLAQARTDVENAKSSSTPAAYESALSMLDIAEGSDWFWWYGDDHVSANDDKFDELFRWYIRQAYMAVGLIVPAAVYEPIVSTGGEHVLMAPSRSITPTVNGLAASEAEWEGAGYYDASLAGGVMHHAVDIFKRLWFGSDNGMLYFRCDTNRPLFEDEKIELEFSAPHELYISYAPKSLSVQSSQPLCFSNSAFAMDEVMELSVPCRIFFGDTNCEEPVIHLRVCVTSRHGVRMYPPTGTLQLQMDWRGKNE